jgi:hypothetical protein
LDGIPADDAVSAHARLGIGGVSAFNLGGFRGHYPSHYPFTICILAPLVAKVLIFVGFLAFATVSVSAFRRRM